ncbi:MAG TPA: hypothetical protein DDZ66_12315 [Firmicutes bacterium]|jgi:putative ABC transport system permease protein|nr:hypothetical protein [Bacillota bacterium]
MFTLKLIRKRPTRSLLTALQIGLGVWIIALVLSMNFQGTNILDGLGSLAKIYVAEATTETTTTILPPGSSRATYTFDDLTVLHESEHIENAFLYSTFGWWHDYILIDGSVYRVSSGANSSPGYVAATNLRLVEGHFFTEIDQKQRSQVILISDHIKERVFPNQSALGKTIVLKHERTNQDFAYEIIGVYEPQPPLLNYWVRNAQFIIPLGNQASSDQWLYHDVFIKSKPGQVYEAGADAQDLLAHRASERMETRIAYFKDYDEVFRSSIQSASLFLGVLAFISVLVSGIGVLSILLVSVVERTKEIGLRRSLGASRISIIGLIQSECLIWVGLGSALGLVAAHFTAEKVSSLLAQSFDLAMFGTIWGLHPRAALISVVLALGSGFLFGLYPAFLAANMPAVEALREH